ncbi:MAG: hypothetical protein JRG92_10905 [Deltaproteobacteria bacterium]|nr:hypothetical protein [Deltaproteobacteria bacterium]MBW2384135.1 hypothetical protein [Deltaproteobacteria bacterium]MBW2698623.1 hypothetical protein [Deltaproteobacteria bacterium]
MNSNRRALRLLLVGLVSVGLLAACGGQEEAPEAPATAEPERSASAPTGAEPPAPAPRADRAERPSSKPPEGAAAQLSRTIELPDYYPSDAPVYPGTEPSSAKRNAAGRIAVVFGTSDSPEQVLEYMVGYLPGAGWEITGQQDLPGGPLLQASQGERLLSVLLSRLDEGKPSEITVIAVGVDP